MPPSLYREISKAFLFNKNIQYMGGFSLVEVIRREGESDYQLARRFKKKVIRSGILSSVRNKRWFISKSERRRMEKKKAIRRIRKKQRRNKY